MPENKTEVQLKAKATNWLLTALIGVVSWIGKQQNDALQQISQDLKTVSGTVQVHTAEISNLKETTSNLSGKIERVRYYERPVGKHEEFFEMPIHPLSILPQP